MTKGALNTGNKVFLVDGRRTPFGKFGGSLKDVTPVDLAVIAAKACLESQPLSPKDFDQVIFGNVLPSTTDTLYGARHIALKLGMPIETPGLNVNRLCGSGIQAILDAARAIKLGESELVLAAGAENMSMAPHLLYGGRFGTKYGGLKSVDMLTDTLSDKFCGTSMGMTAENLAVSHKIEREECDTFALQSHVKAEKAVTSGAFDLEITPISEKSIQFDEHLRPGANIEQMTKLKPSFKQDGVVTPGSASGIVDGACAVIIASEVAVKKHGLTPLAEIIDGMVVGVDPNYMGIGPVPSIEKLLSRNNMVSESVDIFEINEAFAAQTLACMKDLNIPWDKINLWGGAIAIGHPLGATGIRISLTLAKQLVYYKKKYGVASACIGGGQGISLLIKKV